MVDCSAEQFARLILERNNKAYGILRRRGASITLALPPASLHDRPARQPAEILDCNQFYVSLQKGTLAISIPLCDLELSFDHSPGAERLMLVLNRTRW